MTVAGAPGIEPGAHSYFVRMTAMDEYAELFETRPPPGYSVSEVPHRRSWW